MYRIAVLLLCLGVTYCAAGTASAAPAPPQTTPVATYAESNGACVDAEEQAFLGLINHYRAQNGLGPVQMSHKMNGAADFHSSEMADYNYFSHTLRNGVSWYQNIQNFGYTAYTWMAENIAAGNPGAQGTFDQWRNSPGHNSTMLSASVAVIGIGRAYNANSSFKWYWTTVFGGYVYPGDGAVPCAAASAPAPTTHRIVASYRVAGSVSSVYAYDGNLGTSWYTTWAAPPRPSAYVDFDLGSPKGIGSIQWVFQHTGYADAYRIQVSNDRAAWTTLGSFGNAPAGAWGGFPTPGLVARYVRYAFANPNGDGQLGSLAEVKFTT